MPKIGAKPAATRKPAARTRTKPKPATPAEDPVAETGAAEDPAQTVDPSDWREPEYAKDPGDFDFDALDDTDEIIRVLYYGPEGSAKTTNLADMVNMAPEGNVLVVNAEGGLRKSALQKRGVDTSRIMVWPRKGEALTFEGLERLYYRLQADLEQDPLSWIGWAWDSDTAIYQAMLDSVIDEVHRKAAEVLKRAGKGRNGRAGNITLPDRFESDLTDYYNKMSQQFRLLLRKWRSLDCHFAMTALLRRDEDRKTKAVMYGPAVSPAISTDVLAYVDVVVQCFTAETPDGPVWWGRTHGTEESRGKDRLGVLPHRMVEPTMSRIQDYLHGDLTEETDPLQLRAPKLERLEAEQEGPKRGKVTGVKAPRKTAAKKPAPEPEEPPDDQAQAEETTVAPEPDEAQAEDPKRAARARPRARTPRGGSVPAQSGAETPARPAAEAKAPAARRPATRRNAKEATARAEVKAETEDKPKRVRAKGVRRAVGTKPLGADNASDKPPF